MHWHTREGDARARLDQLSLLTPKDSLTSSCTHEHSESTSPLATKAMTALSSEACLSCLTAEYICMKREAGSSILPPYGRETYGSFIRLVVSIICPFYCTALAWRAQGNFGPFRVPDRFPSTRKNPIQSKLHLHDGHVAVASLCQGSFFLSQGSPQSPQRRHEGHGTLRPRLAHQFVQWAGACAP